MLFCAWTLPELGPFGNYLLFIWNAFKIHCISRLICMEDLWHVNLTCPGASPYVSLIDMHGKCMACKPYMSGGIPMFRGTYLVYYVITVFG